MQGLRCQFTNISVKNAALYLSFYPELGKMISFPVKSAAVWKSKNLFLLRPS